MPLGSRYRAKSTGSVRYSHKVLVSIISLATEEIQGVTALAGRGVRIDVNDKEVTIDVYVDVSTKVSCSDVAFRVQENIKKSLETMTDFKAAKINVNVLGLNFDEEHAVVL